MLIADDARFCGVLEKHWKRRELETDRKLGFHVLNKLEFRFFFHVSCNFDNELWFNSGYRFLKWYFRKRYCVNCIIRISNKSKHTKIHKKSKDRTISSSSYVTSLRSRRIKLSIFFSIIYSPYLESRRFRSCKEHQVLIRLVKNRVGPTRYIIRDTARGTCFSSILGEFPEEISSP